MVKKFKEYIKESKGLINFISLDELEDQFLRLKEVFNCKIIPSYSVKRWGIYKEINITIRPPESNTFNRNSVEGKKWINSVNNELLQIQNRLENIYHIKFNFIGYNDINNLYLYNINIYV